MGHVFTGWQSRDDLMFCFGGFELDFYFPLLRKKKKALKLKLCQK